VLQSRSYSSSLGEQAGCLRAHLPSSGDEDHGQNPLVAYSNLSVQYNIFRSGLFRPRATRRRELKKARTRQLVADTAARLFAERGYEHVAGTDVARAAEVAEQTVYNRL
jgi:hypothetical protein